MSDDEINVPLVAKDLLCGDTCRELLDFIHDKIAQGKGVISFAAVMAGLQKALEIGIDEGQEIGKELANDRIAAVRPSAN